MRKYIIIIFSFLFLLITSCTEEYERISSESNTVTFHFQPNSYVDESGGTTRTSDSIPAFSSLYYFMLNEGGEMASPIRSSVSGDFQSISMSGLKSGHYSIVFLAIEKRPGENNDAVHELKSVQDLWLSVSEMDNTLNKRGYYKGKMDFELQPEQALSLTVTLHNMSSKINVEVKTHQQVIQDIKISLDDPVATGFTGEGGYVGEKSIQDLSIMPARSIEVFPFSNGAKVSGKVLVTFADIDGVLHKESYLFSDCVLEANKISTVKVELSNPYEGLDQLNVSPADFTDENTWRILTDSEPDSIVFNQNRRSFRINEPLQVDLKTEGKFHFIFYSAHPIDDAHILICSKEISDEYFEIAHFERIEILQEAYMPFTLSGEKDKKYKTESGRIITVRAGKKIDMNNIDFKIVCNDPYWKKIEQIKAKWLIRFSTYGTSPEKPTNGYWRYMRPNFCRQAIALFTNIAWMNETEEYRELLVSNNGKYWVNAARTEFIQDNTTVISKLRNKSVFTIGLVGVADGLSSSAGKFGVAGYIYNGHYSAPYHAYVVFHELGHCMGYPHKTALVDGLWAQKHASPLYLQMAKELKLPVSEKHWLNDFPN